MLLARKDRSLDNVIRVLVEYRDNIGDATTTTGAKEEEKEGGDDGTEQVVDQATEQREILGHLIEYLKSLD